jgi:hypothetical protein
LRRQKKRFSQAIDLYDPAGGLYKLWLVQTLLRVPGTGTLGVNGATELWIANFYFGDPSIGGSTFNRR